MAAMLACGRFQLSSGCMHCQKPPFAGARDAHFNPFSTPSLHPCRALFNVAPYTVGPEFKAAAAEKNGIAVRMLRVPGRRAGGQAKVDERGLAGGWWMSEQDHALRAAAHKRVRPAAAAGSAQGCVRRPQPPSLPPCPLSTGAHQRAAGVPQPHPPGHSWEHPRPGGPARVKNTAAHFARARRGLRARRARARTPGLTIGASPCTRGPLKAL